MLKHAEPGHCGVVSRVLERETRQDFESREEESKHTLYPKEPVGGSDSLTQAGYRQQTAVTAVTPSAHKKEMGHSIACTPAMLLPQAVRKKITIHIQ